jgi:ubiquinol-cytochrome c reductase cytochrome b subunit
MMATAFMGYVLPWGQMSFWGATVITNLFSTIPFVGQNIVEWLWGGFSIENPTLNRFFSLHYFLPFIIAGLSLVHLVLLHQNGSTNPLGIDMKADYLPFYPYFYVKDLLGFFGLLLVFLFYIYYYPNDLGHPDNYITADTIKTPPHIVPEWYFLPFYAILRSIESKVGGVVTMFASILVLLFLPFINTSEVRSSTFRPIFVVFYWMLVSDFLLLGWVGQQDVDTPYIEIGQYATVFYFVFFLVIVPVVGILEKYLVYRKIK